MALTMVGTQTPQKLFQDVPACGVADAGHGDAEHYCGDAEYGGLGCDCGGTGRGESEPGDWARAAAINNARLGAGQYSQGSGALSAIDGKPGVWDGLWAESVWRGVH